MPGQEPVRVGIAGVRGYAGLEAMKILAHHEGFRVVTASSDALAGARLRKLDPELAADGDAVVVGHNDTVAAARAYDVDIMFLALPASAAAVVAGPLLDAGVRVVDLSGAHRVVDPAAHKRAYGFQRAREMAGLYGLTEWTPREQLAEARLVANPGCFPTAVLLALLPLVQARILDPSSVVVDAKSGTTGAGRSAKVSLLHAEIFGNMYAYRVGQHQHTPEMAQQLAVFGEGPCELTFVSHLLPVARGILATSYLRVRGQEDPFQAADQVRETLRARYAGEPFVRVLDRAEDVQLKEVVGTNRCLMSATADPFGKRVVIVSAIDNLIKGAAGQAVQNANLMVGFDQTQGLAPGKGWAR